MSLLTPWFLAGLLALAPLLALHLRRRRRRQEVSSLLLWRELPGAAPSRRRTSLVASLLLLLQALIVVLLVLALARPARDGEPARAGAAPEVFVLDGSVAMTAPGRLPAAKRQLDRRIARLPSQTPVSLVEAGASPRLLVADADPDAARAALARVRADAPRADLRAGLALAAGQLRRAGGTVTLVHALEDSAPSVRTDGVAFAAVAIGDRIDDQALEPPVARCDPAQSAKSPARCIVFAAVRNDAPATVRTRLEVERAGQATVSRALTIGAGARVELTFDAEPGARLTLRLTRDDAIAANDSAQVAVPDSSAPTAVTLVSDRPRSAPLARALAATPGVTLRLVAPDAFGDGDLRSPALVVFDRWLPGGDLPAARALLLIAPPRLPGGRVGGALPDPQLSGEQPADPLLAGVELDALALSEGAAHRVELPPALHAVAWAPGGPLLAAAEVAAARPSRIALLTFDPQASTLPQLPAFPILLANVVDWSHGRAPLDGTPPAVAPAANASGAGAATDTGATPPAAPSADAVALRAGDGGGPAPSPPREWWPWLAAAGLLVLLAEWSHPLWARRRTARA